MRLPSLLLSAFLLAACDGENDTGTPETGTPDDTGSSTAIGVAGLDQGDCLAKTRTPPVDSLSATSVGKGVVAVVHAFEDNCCAHFAVSAAATDFVVDVTYTDEGELCDCFCPWELHYQLTGLTAGTWTIQARGLSAEVVVE
jgi:hypothetical protein